MSSARVCPSLTITIGIRRFWRTGKIGSLNTPVTSCQRQADRRSIDGLETLLNPWFWHCATKKHHIGHERAAAGQTVGRYGLRYVVVGYIGVAVGTRYVAVFRDKWICGE